MKYTSKEWIIEDVQIGSSEERIFDKIISIETPTLLDHTFKICILVERKNIDLNSSNAVEEIIYVHSMIITNMARFTVTYKSDLLPPIPNEYLYI